MQKLSGVHGDLPNGRDRTNSIADLGLLEANKGSFFIPTSTILTSAADTFATCRDRRRKTGFNPKPDIAGLPLMLVYESTA
jgi:hypothetical protein